MTESKIDPTLLDILQRKPDGLIDVIVKTVDGLQPADRQAVEQAGGFLKADLYIVDSFSARMSAVGVEALSDNPRVMMLFYDAPVKML
ncbi:MAG: hypothetical protein ACYCW6_29445 [Candidatus Xenobia bacterium]